MRTVTALFLAVMVSATAHADEIGDKAKTCWSLLPSDYGLGGTVEMAVTVKGSLVEGIAVSNYTPDDARGYSVAQAAAKAVQQCSPYQVADGVHQVVMDVHGQGDSSSTVTIPKPGRQ